MTSQRPKALPPRFASLIIAVFSVFSFLLMAAFGISSGWNTYRMTQELQAQTLSQAGHQIAFRIQDEITRSRDWLQVWVTSLSQGHGRAVSDIAEEMTLMLEQHPIYGEFQITDATGKVLAAGEHQKPPEGALAPLPKPPASVLKERLGQFSWALPSGAGGLGVTRISVDLMWAWLPRFSDLDKYPLPEGASAETIIVRASDHLVMYGPKELWFKPLAMKLQPEAVTNSPSWSVETWPDGHRYLESVQRVELIPGRLDSQVIILLRQPEDSSWRVVLSSLPWDLGSAGLIGLVFLVAAFFAGRHLTRPLVELAQAARAYSRGEIDAIPSIRGVREIENLSTSFADLVADLSLTATARSHAERQATHDALTELPNRRALDAYMIDTMAWQHQNLSRVFLFIDLDGFKAINDSHGHDAGDLVLKRTAERLRNGVRGESVCIRLGGDEFLVILTLSHRIAYPAEAAAAQNFHGQIRPLLITEVAPVGQRLIDTIGQSIDWETGGKTRQLTVGASIGAAIWPLDQTDPVKVLKQADEAMYTAKRRGKNCLAWYAPTVS